MIPIQLQSLANHLWQSTLFAAVAGLLTLALRKNRAQTRYWLWLAASVKFLVPFSLLVDLGRRFGSHTVSATSAPNLSYVIEQASQPFTVSTPLGTITRGSREFARKLDSGSFVRSLGDRVRHVRSLLVSAVASSPRSTAHGFPFGSAHWYQSDDLTCICGARCLWGTPAGLTAALRYRRPPHTNGTGSDCCA